MYRLALRAVPSITYGISKQHHVVRRARRSGRYRPCPVRLVCGVRRPPGPALPVGRLDPPAGPLLGYLDRVLGCRVSAHAFGEPAAPSGRASGVPRRFPGTLSGTDLISRRIDPTVTDRPGCRARRDQRHRVSAGDRPVAAGSRSMIRVHPPSRRRTSARAIAQLAKARRSYSSTICENENRSSTITCPTSPKAWRRFGRSWMSFRIWASRSTSPLG
jgi:hypothetical protein